MVTSCAEGPPWPAPHTPVCSSNLHATGSAAVMAVQYRLLARIYRQRHLRVMSEVAPTPDLRARMSGIVLISSDLPSGSEVSRGPGNVCFRGQSRSRFRATGGLLLAISGLKPLRKINRILTHRDAGGGSRPSHSGHVRSRWRMSPGLAAWFGKSCGGSMNYN